MGSIAIIPARIGSKRLPKKNIALVNGRPIITYPVDACIASNLFSEVIVSTDSQEIAQIVEHAGAKVIYRDGYLSGDQASVVEVCLDTINRRAERPDSFCCVYATFALASAGDLQKSYTRLEEGDFVVGVSEYTKHPYEALVFEGNKIRRLFPQHAGLKSQQYPRSFASNGSIYWAKTDAFLRSKNFIGSSTVPYFVESIDIDTMTDLATLNKFMHERNQRKLSPSGG